MVLWGICPSHESGIKTLGVIAVGHLTVRDSHILHTNQCGEIMTGKAPRVYFTGEPLSPAESLLILDAHISNRGASKSVSCSSFPSSSSAWFSLQFHSSPFQPFTSLCAMGLRLPEVAFCSHSLLNPSSISDYDFDTSLTFSYFSQFKHLELLKCWLHVYKCIWFFPRLTHSDRWMSVF